jgi:hypothetical protein
MEYLGEVEKTLGREKVTQGEMFHENLGKESRGLSL